MSLFGGLRDTLVRNFGSTAAIQNLDDTLWEQKKYAEVPLDYLWEKIQDEQIYKGTFKDRDPPTYKIVKTCGYVSANFPAGVHAGRDLAVQARGLIGGRSQALSNVMDQTEMEIELLVIAKALAKGANAVTSYDIRYDSESKGGDSHVMAHGSGDAVVLEFIK